MAEVKAIAKSLRISPRKTRLVVDLIRGKKVAIIDDVISTGESLHALEVLVEKALEYVKDGDSVIDLCSGSGCIGITVALNRKVVLSALDISHGAGEIFKKNCKKHHVFYSLSATF